MLTSLTLGAQLDLATGAEVKEQADRIVDSVGGMFDRTNRLPIYTLRTASKAFAASTGQIVLSVGTPPSGRVWQLVRASVVLQEQADSDYVQIPATSFAALYVGTPPQLETESPSPASFVGMFPRETGVVDPPTRYPVLSIDTVFCVFRAQSALAAAVHVTFNAMFAELREKAELRSVL